MVCKQALGKIARHHVLNDIIWQAFVAAGSQESQDLEPLFYVRSSTKRVERAG